MKIIVTGSDGLVGSAFRKIEHEYPQYKFVFHSRKDSDLFNFNETMSKIISYEADCVIHLAGYVGGLYKNIKHKVSMLQENLIINYNMINISHLNNLKFIGCLSTCIFPDNTSYPITEDMLFKGPPHDSNYGYAYAKRMMEIQCRTYRDQFNSDFRCFIPTNLYGPNDNFCLEDGHVIPSLIHKCFVAKRDNKDFVVLGSGNPLRQFMYAEDFANIILQRMNDENRNPVIVAPKEEVTIKKVAWLIAKSFGYEERMVFDTSKEDGQFKKTALSKINYNFKNIEDGIKETVEWFIDNYYLARR